ncbi:MAG: hypothetical protein ACK559_04085, partial [bacterium]
SAPSAAACRVRSARPGVEHPLRRREAPLGGGGLGPGLGHPQPLGRGAGPAQLGEGGEGLGHAGAILPLAAGHGEVFPDAHRGFHPGLRVERVGLALGEAHPALAAGVGVGGQ